jgi:hypothetical protein
MIRLLLVSLLTFFCAPFCRAAETISCPATVATHQNLAAPVAGWTSMLDDTPQSLAGITFYDGAPAEKASLVYDQIKHGKGEDIATWTFVPQKDRQIWLVCSYAGTVVELSRSLPSQITTCAVTYDTQKHIAGLPPIKRIACH